MNKDNIKCAVLLSNETEMSVRRFSAIPHLSEFLALFLDKTFTSPQNFFELPRALHMVYNFHINKRAGLFTYNLHV